MMKTIMEMECTHQHLILDQVARIWIKNMENQNRISISSILYNIHNKKQIKLKLLLKRYLDNQPPSNHKNDCIWFSLKIDLFLILAIEHRC